MNNETAFFILFGVCCAAAGFFGYQVLYIVKAFIKVRQNKIDFPYLVSADKDRLCKGPHSYERTKLVFPQLPADEYLVCKDCGFISSEGGKYMLNKPALEVFKNNLERSARKQEGYKSLLTKKQEALDEAMNRLIKMSIEKFDGDIHKNIPELQQFFRKTTMEVESLYSSLKKDMDNIDNRG